MQQSGGGIAGRSAQQGSLERIPLRKAARNNLQLATQSRARHHPCRPGRSAGAIRGQEPAPSARFRAASTNIHYCRPGPDPISANLLTGPGSHRNSVTLARKPDERRKWRRDTVGSVERACRLLSRQQEQPNHATLALMGPPGPRDDPKGLSLWLLDPGSPLRSVRGGKGGGSGSGASRSVRGGNSRRLADERSLNNIPFFR